MTLLKFYSITKKEFIDKISDRTFMFIYAITLIAVIVNSYSASLEFNKHVSNLLQYNNELDFIINSNMNFLLEGISNTISEYCGILAFLLTASGFIKEKKSGALKVLMSYPVFRDSVILGKQLAWLVIITLITFSSYLIGISIIIYVTGVSFSLIWITNILSSFILSILYLLIFIELGCLLSQVFSNPANSILFGLTLILVFNSSFWYYTGNFFAKLIYGSPYVNVYFDGVLNVLYDPSVGYLHFIDMFNTLNPTESYFNIMRNMYIVTVYSSRVSDLMIGVNESLIKITVIITYSVVLFLANYYKFHHTELQ